MCCTRDTLTRFAAKTITLIKAYFTTSTLLMMAVKSAMATNTKWSRVECRVRSCKTESHYKNSLNSSWNEIKLSYRWLLSLNAKNRKSIKHKLLKVHAKQKKNNVKDMYTYLIHKSANQKFRAHKRPHCRILARTTIRASTFVANQLTSAKSPT